METFAFAEFQEPTCLKGTETRSASATTVDVTVAQVPIEKPTIPFSTRYSTNGQLIDRDRTIGSKFKSKNPQLELESRIFSLSCQFPSIAINAKPKLCC